MKLFLSLIAILAFSALAIFGFTGMSHTASFDGHGGFTRCLVLAVQGTDCPRAESGIGITLFHLDILHAFSTAVFQSSVAVLLVSLSLSLFAFWGRGRELFAGRFGVILDLFRHRIRQDSIFAYAGKKSFFSWLTNLEKRDPALSF